MRVVTSAEVREIDRRTTAEFGISTKALMEAAGREVARSATVGEGPVLILCGPGNNGGDGLAAARFLHEEDCDVTVLLSAPADDLKGEALAQYRRAAESGVRILGADSKFARKSKGSLDDFAVLVDALLGTGQRAPLGGPIADLVTAVDDFLGHTISVDVPTGIDCDTGAAVGPYIQADETVVLGFPKPYLFQGEGVTAAGEWFVADIGFPLELVEGAGRAELLDEPWALRRLQPRPVTAHKKSVGTALVVGGSRSYPGAPSLAALGAYRSGAGLVSIASIDFVLEGVRNTLPEAIHLPLPESAGSIAEVAAESVARAASDFDCTILGPGLGREAGVRGFLEKLFQEGEPTHWVLDADALYWLPDLKARPKGTIVLTPHEGEAARLLGWSPGDVRANRVESAKQLAEKFDAVAVLKGPHTLICAPEHDLLIGPRGSTVLATAGTGDVLAGAIGALIARRCCPTIEAAATAVFLHGTAGEDWEAAEIGGQFGAIAREIANGIPAAASGLVARYLDRLGGTWDDGDEDDWFAEQEGAGDN